MIKRIWLYPPLAFARVGGSPKPCENFYWGPDDLMPGGTARTRIIGAETLEVAGDGTVTACPPNGTVIFKDGDCFRPVCPFFELHAAWDEGGTEVEGPLTTDRLQQFGLSQADLKWRVDVANLKAFHFTASPGDRIAASVEIQGGEFGRQDLRGASPAGENPLVPQGAHIPLGTVQATRPTAEFPEFRLRFTPPSGKVYAPKNVLERVGKLQQVKDPEENFDMVLKQLAEGVDAAQVLNNFLLSINTVWKDFDLPKEQRLLNPDAQWPKYRLIGTDHLLAQAANFLPRLAELYARRGRGDRSELIRAFLGPRADVRNLPPSVFAFAAEPPDFVASLGMVDDMGDGTVSVELREMAAASRIVIAPPSFAPDRRLPVSIADGLVDRVNRAQVRDPQWAAGNNQLDADAEVADLLDRAFETAGLQNIDAVVDFFREENRNLAWRRGSPFNTQQAADQLWDSELLRSVQKKSLTAVALQRHRRNTTRLLFEAFARETDDWFEAWIRPPADPKRFYDKRMPGLMRGSDRYPLHLTRRQYEMLKNWSEQRRKP